MSETVDNSSVTAREQNVADSADVTQVWPYLPPAGHHGGVAQTTVAGM